MSTTAKSLFAESTTSGICDKLVAAKGTEITKGTDQKKVSFEPTQQSAAPQCGNGSTKKGSSRRIRLPSKPMCFNCHASDHITEQCTKEKFCQWCNAAGHRECACPKFDSFKKSADAIMAKSDAKKEEAYNGLDWLGKYT